MSTTETTHKRAVSPCKFEIFEPPTKKQRLTRNFVISKEMKRKYLPSIESSKLSLHYKLESDELTRSSYNNKLSNASHSHFINNLSPIQELKSHKGCVNCASWDLTGKYLISGSDDTLVKLWDPLGISNNGYVCTYIFYILSLY